ncbi:MAG: SDR family oxidoreductase [Deltaproteobacteria bacterium]|nr:SDR family oxidoreductase [Deltaproteobacteria bacterium]
MRRLMIFGATSALAQATARRFAMDGSRFFLVARDRDKLAAVADDLRVRGATLVTVAVADALDFHRHEALVDGAFTALDGLDTLLVSHGSLPDQTACQQDVETLRREFDVNALAVISVLTHAANRFARQGFGSLVAIGSVAGDRGRQSNYVYGAAKGAVAIFMQGLRNRLHGCGVHVLTVKPGFVDTPMTAAFPKGVLWATPQQVTRGIHRAIEKRRDVVYLPGFWRPVMGVLRAVPEALFKRLRL